ncbi:FAD-binding oxidoreductase [Pararhodobacter sp. CCB-MM2]|uniref:NAD(P)/FAD-dependent oxidoreductase n=1 Tax=Pararhodobacter sp. CCB-MM2 TaxID=1786003 RepID=UPI00082A0404|nr:FAD-binding oxidoreductase [Pararhodobacter sp. CCB-MM2]
MHVVIIGSGILGSSIAYECAKAGAQVTVIDAGRLGGVASGTSFAWLNATSKAPKSYYTLNALGMRAHLELKRDFGATPWRSQTGSLEWRTTEAGRAWQRGNFEQMRDWGYGIEWITKDRLAQMEPDIDLASIGDAPIVYYPEEGWVDPVLYAAWLHRAAREKHGAVLRPHTEVTGIVSRNNRAVAVTLAGGETVEADVIVNASGARSDRDLGVPALPMTSTAGMLGFTPPVPTTLRSQFHIDDLDVRPDGAGRLMIHKASVDTGLASTEGVTTDGPEAEALLEATRKVLPLLRDLRLEAVRTTLRPMPRDGFTCIGAMTDMTGYYVAVTHSGVTLAPYLGRALADEIVRGQPHNAIAPFTPDRFFRDPSTASVSAELVGVKPVEGPA